MLSFVFIVLSTAYLQPSQTTMPFVDTLRHALEQLRAKFKADVPPHKVGDEELTVDPALQGVEKEVRQGEVEFDGLVPCI